MKLVSIVTQCGGGEGEGEKGAAVRRGGGGEMRKSSKYTICKSRGLSRCQVKYKISLTKYFIVFV